jgi:hypothetical protein
MNSTMKMHKGHACGWNLMTSTNLASWMYVVKFVGWFVPCLDKTSLWTKFTTDATGDMDKN